ncbi:proton-conducting transporter transmembrane domain-containing protein [Planctomicrobium piriforme]|uniref:NAD(P)H-quinone oxidoreductase subunit 5 n=1 Tax=Planctomicrobium piriforme TaxID=1576369 RepID=A0A1I3HNR7_9PLAN|nr:proton-conducting transporter membrane subunit [Planctomicrobium piriforme]SFI37394.1 NAD(P)H-quinone oxidoreductase subunit 5 [Planctomicrobium piriforme]
MMIERVYFILGVCSVAAPLLLVTVLGGSTLVNRHLSERTTARLTQLVGFIGFIACVSILGTMLARGDRRVPIELGNWVVLPDPHFHFHFTIKLVFDRLSVPFAILTFVLCEVIAAFGRNYLHRESGYQRFFLLFSLFQMGMILTAVAGTIETLFAGWELVGLSSALLVAFFQTRPGPVRNGLRVWMVYRVADAAFLLAAIALHHLTGEGDFDKLTGTALHPWPEGISSVTAPGQALFVGLLLLVAAAGKSALIPFSGWLPRAMEGPTPSSAIFYGALSVHLGAYLLLRVSPLLTVTPWLWGTVIALGLLTTAFAAITETVQTDIKAALSYASLTQIGLIVAEIGLGAGIGGKIGILIWYFALMHMIGHACLRTLQFLRAPSLLRDYGQLENAIGSRLQPNTGSWEPQLPVGMRNRVYRMAMERGYLDPLLTNLIVTPFLKLFRKCDSLERKWASLLQGPVPASPHHSEPITQAVEQLP